MLERLSSDLTARVGRGFGVANMYLMRQFYLTWPPEQILQTLSGGTTRPAILQTASGESVGKTAAKPTSLPGLGDPAWQGLFPLPWSAYVRLLSVDGDPARRFYETEALRNGWTVRQLDRQINSMFFERIALSKDKTAMLLHGGQQAASDQTVAREAIRDPFILEFLDLKDEYSETDLEDALIDHLAEFLLELGDDFTFLARQRRMRIDDRWFRCDLVLFHRTLRCLVLIDLKIGRYSYEAAGQMGMYLSYARHNWMKDGENPPVGLILCSSKGADEARYSLDSLSSPVLTAQYKLALPDTKLLEAELARTRQVLEQRERTSTDQDGHGA